MSTIKLTNQTEPLTPSAGVTTVYIDSATKKLFTKDDTGAVNTAAAAGGSNTQVQFNDSGNLDGDSDFTWDKTTNTLELSGVDTGIRLKAVTNLPSSVPSDTARLYARKIAGRVFPSFISELGIHNPLQTNLMFNNCMLWTPNTLAVGTGTGFGKAWNVCTGTISHPTPTVESPIKRMRLANIATTANQILGFTGSAAVDVLVNNAAGWFFSTRFITEIVVTANSSWRLFVGMTNKITGIVAADAVTNDSIGLSHITTDSNTTLAILANDGTTTNRVEFTVPQIVSGNAYDFVMTCPAGGSEIFYKLSDSYTKTVLAEGSVTINTPRIGVMMGPQVQMSNATNGTVTTTAIGIAKIYIETDL